MTCAKCGIPLTSQPVFGENNDQYCSQDCRQEAEEGTLPLQQEDGEEPPEVTLARFRVLKT